MRDKDKIDALDATAAGEEDEKLFSSEFILVLRKSSWLVLGSLFISIGGLFFWFIGGHLSGSVGVGYATAAISTAGIIAGVFTLGLNVAVLKLIPSFGARAYYSALFIGVTAGLLAASLSLFFTDILEGFSTYIPLVYLLVVIGIISTVSSSSLVALLDTKWIFLSNIMAVTIKLVVVSIALYLLSLDGIGITLSVIASQIAVAILLTYRVIARLGVKLPGTENLKETLRYGIANYPQILSNQLIINTGVVLIAWLTGNASVTGVFYISLMITLVISTIPSSMATLSLPTMERTGKNNLAHLSMMLGSAVMVPLAVFVGTASKWLLGIINKDFTIGSEALSLLSLSVIPLTVILNAQMYFNRQDRLREITYTGVVRLVLLISLLYILTPKWGINGASLSFLASAIAPLPLIARYGFPFKGALKLHVAQTLFLALGIMLSFKISDILAAIIASSLSLVALHVSGELEIPRVLSLARTVYYGKGERG